METVTSILLIAGVGIVGIALVVFGARGALKEWRKDKDGIQD